jgi:hypothetical protein
MAQLVVANVDKAGWIPHSNVIPPTFEGDDGEDVWRVQNQHHPNVTYKIHAPFIEYKSFPLSSSSTCEVTFANIKLLFYWFVNLTMDNIIEYCGMYYGTHYGGLKCMFVDLAYL